MSPTAPFHHMQPSSQHPAATVDALNKEEGIFPANHTLILCFHSLIAAARTHHNEATAHRPDQQQTLPTGEHSSALCILRNPISRPFASSALSPQKGDSLSPEPAVSTPSPHPPEPVMSVVVASPGIRGGRSSPEQPTLMLRPSMTVMIRSRGGRAGRSPRKWERRRAARLWCARHAFSSGAPECVGGV